MIRTVSKYMDYLSKCSENVQHPEPSCKSVYTTPFHCDYPPWSSASERSLRIRKPRSAASAAEGDSGALAFDVRCCQLPREREGGTTGACWYFISGGINIHLEEGRGTFSDRHTNIAFDWETQSPRSVVIVRVQ